VCETLGLRETQEAFRARLRLAAFHLAAAEVERGWGVLSAHR
jgi:hypothetical protein